jgi:hypothetical protein
MSSSRALVERERGLQVGPGPPARALPPRLLGHLPAKRRSHHPQGDAAFGDAVLQLRGVGLEIVKVLRLTPPPGPEHELVVANDRRPTAIAEVRDDQARRWLRVVDQRDQALALPLRIELHAEQIGERGPEIEQVDRHLDAARREQLRRPDRQRHVDALLEQRAPVPGPAVLEKLLAVNADEHDHGVVELVALGERVEQHAERLVDDLQLAAIQPTNIL